MCTITKYVKTIELQYGAAQRLSVLVPSTIHCDLLLEKSYYSLLLIEKWKFLKNSSGMQFFRLILTEFEQNLCIFGEGISKYH